MKNLRSEIIKYSKMLNSKNLSALRSGNISSRYKDGFLITPSGKKYSSLMNKDIGFVTLEADWILGALPQLSEWVNDGEHLPIFKTKNIYCLNIN